MGRLEDPTDPDRMYLDEPGIVPIARPLVFGDVLRDVPCSRGGDPFPLVMLMSHPCSMRSGTVLRERIVVAGISDGPYPGKKSEKWANKHYDFMPLFGLPDAPEIQAVALGELHAASSADLDVSKRVLALSNFGVSVLLQRWIYQLSRDPVPLQDLEEFVAPILAEVEMQEEWCQTALDVAGGDEDPADVLGRGTQRVQELLGKPGSGGLRDQLADPASRADVRRQIARQRTHELGR